MPPRNRIAAAKRETITVTEEIVLAETPAGPAFDPGAWAALTAPLKHYQVPVIITETERAADDAYRDQLRHPIRALHENLVDEWLASAREATYGPCTDPGFRQALLPAMMP